MEEEFDNLIQDYVTTRNCIICGIEFVLKRNDKTCSKKCSKSLRKINHNKNRDKEAWKKEDPKKVYERMKRYRLRKLYKNRFPYWPERNRP